MAQKLTENVTSLLVSSGVPLPAVAHLEVFGNRRVLMDGACEIAECSEDVLVMQVGKTTLRFRGRELCLAVFDKESAVLEGRLSSIEFE